MSEETVKITVRPNGPFRVEGPITLVDVNGNAWDLTGKPAISLCRCGMSSNAAVFCDGIPRTREIGSATPARYRS